MKKISYHTLSLLFVFISSNAMSQEYQYNHTILTPGILKVETLYLDSVKLSDNMIYLKSIEMKVVDSLHLPRDNYALFNNDIEARGYYPQEPYGIIYFDSYPLTNGHYKIFCNGDWYFINNINGFTKYMTWDDFILSIASIGTTIENPLHKRPSIESQKIDYDYRNIRMIPKKIQGEWIYVDVYDVELSNILGFGWLKWRNKSDLLIELQYAH